MTYPRSNPDAAPGPAELVAYVDGQLDALTHRRVELWLALHPAAAADLEEHRQFLRVLRADRLPEPAEARWREAFAAVEAALPFETRTVQRPHRAAGRVTHLAAAAAAVLLLLMPGEFPSGLDERAPPPAPTPFPVASADEVEIVSIDAADLKALLVGWPPLRGELALAAAGDVELHFAEAGENGWVPGLPDQEGAPPMYVAPMRQDAGEKP